MSLNTDRLISGYYPLFEFAMLLKSATEY